MNRHPYSAAWPDMSPEDFAALVASIKTYGLSELKPIRTFDGQILDGWHRYRACTAAGVVPRFDPFPGDDEAAVRFIEIEHTHRSLSAEQRVAAILAMHQARTGAGRPGNHATVAQLAPGSGNHATVARLTEPEIAQRAGVSVRTVARVKEVASKAPEQLDRIRNGEVSAKRVLAEIKGNPERRADKAAPSGCQSCADLTARNAELADELHTAHGTIAELGIKVGAAEAVLAGEAAQKIVLLENSADHFKRELDRCKIKCAELERTCGAKEREIGTLRRRLGE